MDIIMTGYAGWSGTRKIAEAKYNDLKKVYPKWFLENIRSTEKDFGPGLDSDNDLISRTDGTVEIVKKIEDILRKNALVKKSGDEEIILNFSAGQGGIMTALWNLSLARKKGFVIDILSIPIKQETVELSEHYHIDPYRLESDGAFITVVESGSKAILELEKIGVEAEIIGYTTDNKDKIILFDTDKEERCLDRPRADELESVLY